MLTHCMSYQFLAAARMACWQGRNKLWFEFFVIKVWFANLVDGGGGGGGENLRSLSAIK